MQLDDITANSVAKVVYVVVDYTDADGVTRTRYLSSKQKNAKSNIRNMFAGNYKVTYRVEDASGNRTEQSSPTSIDVPAEQESLKFIEREDPANGSYKEFIWTLVPRLTTLQPAWEYTNESIFDDVMSYLPESTYEDDYNFLMKFDFPTTQYIEYTVDYITAGGAGMREPNTMGMHTRGSGFTPMNEYYQLPYDTLRTEEEKIPEMQRYVEEKILTEGALEFAYEGTRYYDIMRFAFRSDNPGQFMADKIYARRGEANKDIVRGEIKKDLTNKENWFLKWKGSIGY